MKQPAKPLQLQFNLPLPSKAAIAVPDDKQRELTLALVELLISAAGDAIPPQNNGGENES